MLSDGAALVHAIDFPAGLLTFVSMIKAYRIAVTRVLRVRSAELLQP